MLWPIVGLRQKRGETEIPPSRPGGRRSQLYAAHGLWASIINRRWAARMWLASHNQQQRGYAGQESKTLPLICADHTDRKDRVIWWSRVIGWSGGPEPLIARMNSMRSCLPLICADDTDRKSGDLVIARDRVGRNHW